MPQRDFEVEACVLSWLDAKQAADADGIRRSLSRYAETLAIGTDASEWFAGQDAFVDAHTSSPAFNAIVERIEAHREGPVAWAAIDAVVDTGTPTVLTVRMTLVLVRDGDDWHIVQTHASAPSTN